ncbi:MAG: hypothetical protein BWY40_00894 [bacterium ADurb.Bin270]|nr:MAG: hypothetical protein BWY40_00894 [bacterium ADurb.Bin270]
MGPLYVTPLSYHDLEPVSPATSAIMMVSMAPPCFIKTGSIELVPAKKRWSEEF